MHRIKAKLRLIDSHNLSNQNGLKYLATGLKYLDWTEGGKASGKAAIGGAEGGSTYTVGPSSVERKELGLTMENGPSGAQSLQKAEMGTGAKYRSD